MAWTFESLWHDQELLKMLTLKPVPLSAFGLWFVLMSLVSMPFVTIAADGGFEERKRSESETCGEVYENVCMTLLRKIC